MTDSEKIDLILSEMQEIRQQSANMVNDITELKQQSARMENDITEIKLTLENEIRVNIQRIAEGHLDLSRQLHEAMKPSNEVEMLAIKVRQLESDAREIKQKIS